MTTVDSFITALLLCKAEVETVKVKGKAIPVTGREGL
jgi:hypothetical protein